MMSLDQEAIDTGTVIERRSDDAYSNAYFYLLEYEGDYYIGYKNKEKCFLVTVNSMSFIEDASEYTIVKHTYCKYCGVLDNSPISNSNDSPSLEVCAACHDYIKENLLELLSDHPRVSVSQTI